MRATPRFRRGAGGRRGAGQEAAFRKTLRNVAVSAGRAKAREVSAPRQWYVPGVGVAIGEVGGVDQSRRFGVSLRRRRCLQLLGGPLVG